MRNIAKLATLIILLAFLGAGCSDNNSQTRSMEQIYAEEGVPVKVEKIVPSHFAHEIEFSAVLSGIEESSASALIADRIVRINANVGDFVEKDSVIVTFPTDNPSANYFQAKVQYDNESATYERMKQYYESGGLSRQAFDNAEAAFRVAEANWDAVRQSVLVRAPISGIITRMNVRESDNVDKEDVLFTVSRTDRLKARIWVPDTDIEGVAFGLPAKAVWQGVELTGKVIQVDQAMNQERQAFGVVVELDNSGGKVQSGVTSLVSVVLYSTDSAIVTERKNISKDESGNFVFIAKDNRAVKRYVTLGHSHLLAVEIVDGLSSGDMLITEGQIHLKDGSTIKILDDKKPSGKSEGQS